MRALGRLFISAGALLIVLQCAPLFAQSPTYGTVRGYVKDQQGAVLQDVKIAASSPEASYTQETSSTSEGAYRLTELQPGTYTVTAERAGFAKFVQENVRVGAGQTLGLDIVLPISGVAETIEVKHNPPMLEIASPGQTINISGDFQRNTPLTGRHSWHEFMELIPGVTAADSAGPGRDYQFRGSFGGSHVFQLDGVDVMTASINSQNFVTLSTEAIADVQVKTSTADPSAPLGVGVVANVVTHSGTNEMHGSGELVYQNRRWNDVNQAGGTTPKVSFVQADASAGGPLLRDRTWFFGTFRQVSADSDVSRTASQLATLKALYPAFQPFKDANNVTAVMGKVTNRLSDNHELMIAGEYDRNPAGANAATNATPLVKSDFSGPWFAARFSSVPASTLTARLTASYNAKRTYALPNDFSHSSRAIFERVALSGGSSLQGINQLAMMDAWPSSFDSLASKYVASADFSHYRQAPAGSHELQFGAYFQHDIEGNSQRYVNGGDAVVEDVLVDPTDPSKGTIPFHHVSYSPDRFVVTKGRSVDIAGYVMDSWRPTPRATIVGGVRVDRIERRDKVFDKQMEDATAVGPRLGVTLALDARGQHLVHGTIGRVHGAQPETAGSAGSVTATRTDSYDLNQDGIFETTFVTPGVTQQSASSLFDPDYHQPYVNEATVGYRGQLLGPLVLDAAWCRRTYPHRKSRIEINAIYVNDVFVGYRDESQNTLNRLTNNVWNWPVYNDVTIQVNTRSARIQLIGSYTRTWRHLEGTWQPNDPAAIIQPDSFPNDRGVGPTTSGPNSYTEGTSPWRDHAARIGAIGLLPWGLQASINYTIESGVWSGPIVTQIATPDLRFGSQTVILSNGRAVSNPLATTTRFAYATRADGQLQTDTLQVLNLHVVKDLKLAFARLQVWVDVFNLPNAKADQSFLSTNLSSAAFGQQASRQAPRRSQGGVRLMF